jgi:chromosome segregation ATPase
VPRREKTKAKEHKHPPVGKYAPETDNVPTSEETVNKTLNTLHNLGNQRFALAPFSEHLNRWLLNLNQAISEFESDPRMIPDDQFTKQYSQIVTNIESDLEKTLQKEATATKAIRSLSEDRVLLEQIEKNYNEATLEIQHRKVAESKRLSLNMDLCKEELDHITQMKTGIFRMSKKNKAQKEAEATQLVNTAESELASANERFAEEQEKLKQEYQRKKQPIIERIQEYEKEIQNQEIDSTLEGRQAACEALINTVNSFLQRKQLSHPD